MNNAALTSVGLQLRVVKVREYNERRSEIRLISTGDI
jgi:hypothetical protein